MVIKSRCISHLIAIVFRSYGCIPSRGIRVVGQRNFQCGKSWIFHQTHSVFIIIKSYFMMTIAKRFLCINKNMRAEELVLKCESWGAMTDFVPPWISWDIHVPIQPKHSVSDQVFIPAAVIFHSYHVISIKTLSNLLCNYHISLQFSYQFAILTFWSRVPT